MNDTRLSYKLIVLWIIVLYFASYIRLLLDSICKHLDISSILKQSQVFSQGFYLRVDAYNFTCTH